MLHSDEDYLNYIEMLDDDTNINSDTLNEMNSVAQFFKEFSAHIKKRTDISTFPDLLHFFSSQLNQKVRKDPSFLDKLSICNNNLESLKELIDSNTDKSENTIKIIGRCLAHGTIIWTKIDE